MKSIQKILSIILVLVLSFSLISCEKDKKTDKEIKDGPGCTDDDWDFYPEGYTAGFPEDAKDSGAQLETWWVETYEECIAAIELLASHGSTFYERSFFAYEGDLFDTKYCFRISNDYAEPIKFGDNPFDRKADSVFVMSYAFFEDVTIDELNYSSLSSYLTFTAGCASTNISFDIKTDEIIFDWRKRSDKSTDAECYVIYKNKYLICTIQMRTRPSCQPYPYYELPDEYSLAIVKSLKTINEKGVVR